MDFSQKPWNARAEEVPPEIFTPYGMIGPEERRCYYWLARHGLSGAGCVVDELVFFQTRAWRHCLDEDYAAAKADLDRLRRDYGAEQRHELWARQIPEIEQRCKDQFAALGD